MTEEQSFQNNQHIEPRRHKLCNKYCVYGSIRYFIIKRGLYRVLALFALFLYFPWHAFGFEVSCTNQMISVFIGQVLIWALEHILSQNVVIKSDLDLVYKRDYDYHRCNRLAERRASFKHWLIKCHDSSVWQQWSLCWSLALQIWHVSPGLGVFILDLGSLIGFWNSMQPNTGLLTLNLNSTYHEMLGFAGLIWVSSAHSQVQNSGC